MSLTPAHISLLRLLAKQAVSTHLTQQTRQQQAGSATRPNPPVLQQANAR